MLLYILIGSLTLNTLGETLMNYDLNSKMKEFGIVPDIIDIAPSNKIKVNFPSGVKADLGNNLTPLQVKNKPSVKWPTKSDQYYTFIMIDPDSPSCESPTLAQIIHWIVGNIQSNDLKKGQTLAQFIPSSPPDNSGFHRYIFLVYKQPGFLKFSEPPINSIEDRMYFKVRNFAKKYHLGQPIAGNFYLAQTDE